jgi:phosphinothricin acetyltransferase
MSSSADIDTAVSIRTAKESDVGAICSIYNHYVINSVVTFDTAEQSHEDRLRWLQLHEQENLPVLIAELNGEIIGWASLSYYHSRCAYRTTVEFSIYLSPNAIGKGVGPRLLAELIALGRSRGYHCIVGLICSENETSIRMSHAFGFETVGELKEVGRKFDRWLNVTFVQKILSSE